MRVKKFAFRDRILFEYLDEWQRLTVGKGAQLVHPVADGQQSLDRGHVKTSETRHAPKGGPEPADVADDGTAAKQSGSTEKHQ